MGCGRLGQKENKKVETKNYIKITTVKHQLFNQQQHTSDLSVNSLSGTNIFSVHIYQHPEMSLVLLRR